MQNILITTLGTTWTIIPELLGYTNPESFDFYKNHPDVGHIKNQRKEFDIRPVNEIWAVTTNGERVKKNIKLLKAWEKRMGEKIPVIRLFSYSELLELNTIQEIDRMTDLTYRVALHAHHRADGGRIYLSLAGGRKNMSANMQSAATIFGCDALLHISGEDKIPNKFQGNEIDHFINIPGREVKCFYPVVLHGKTPSATYLFVEPKFKAENFPLKESFDQPAVTDLVDEIKQREKEAANSLYSLYSQINSCDPQNSFTALQLLHPLVINKLKNEFIGVNPSKKNNDISWLQKIPKAELHCHFGGVLNPAEMIEVAKTNRNDIEQERKKSDEFDRWLSDIEQIVKRNEMQSLPPYNPKQNIRKYWSEKGIPEPLAMAGFLSCFDGRAELLQKYIYGYLQNFKGIGFEAYEKAGDLQGSSLMQNEKSIRKTCEIIKSNFEEQHIRYAEIRFSPVNYCRGGLTHKQVVEIIIDELQDAGHTVFKLIFIASRHNDEELIEKHIALALDMLDSNALFGKMFVGFDLAGAETACPPASLRDMFMQVMERSIPITIHAGENTPVKNIWEAVYHLSAERIGHGLTLGDDKDLMKRIKERKIAIELCPSSNDQIIGYHSFPEEGARRYKTYPLLAYFHEGLKVTLNTDDPGISLTNLTNEYYKAATLCKKGLSKWQILQICRNGFKYGFLPVEEKKELLVKAEEELFEMLNNG